MEKDISFLLVEDEALIAMNLKNELINTGYRFCSHEVTGEKAVKIAKEKKPDLIIMDIRLAGKMDGIEAALQIRSFSDCPIIFTTGYEDSNVTERISKIEHSKILEKPVTLTRLLPALKNFYENC